MKNKYVFSIIVLALVVIPVILLLHYKYNSHKTRRVILISIDTCRADYLSCYGYFHKTTPHIDALAQEGILFENALTPVPITLPGHSSMLTGTTPPRHGVHDNHIDRLDDSNITLAEILKKQGFSTAAVIGSFTLDSRFGLDQGFDYYNDRFEQPLEAGLAHNAERRAEEVSRVAVDWLDKHQDENFFLFLHYFDPHAEYVPPEPFASQYALNPKNRPSCYAGEIAYTDHCIGQVIKKLKELDLYDSTLIIVTADHGESLGEHGELTHAFFIYQETLHVPLIFKLPGGNQPKRIKDRAGIIDIVPTICNLLAIPLDTDVQGRDLSGYLQGKQPSSPGHPLYYCESLTPQKYDANPLLGVVTDRFKYIQTTRPELYDLVIDPHEKNNLANQKPQRARVFQDELKKIIEQTLRTPNQQNTPGSELDEQALQKLASLGYIAGSTNSGDLSFDQTKDDPKDLIKFHLNNARVSTMISQEKYAQAQALCKEMLARKPTFIRPYRNLSTIAKKQGKPDHAISYLQQALKIDPLDIYARNTLAILFMETDKPTQAIEHFTESLRLKPFQVSAHNKLAQIFLDQKNLEKAIEHYLLSLKVKSQQSYTLTQLANVYMQLGQLDNALKHWSLAVEIEPDSKSLNNLAWIKAVHTNPKYHDPKKALELASHACELTNHEDPGTLDTLAAAYAATGKFTEAVQTAQKAESMYLSLGQKKEVEDIRKRLELYKSNQPYRENL